MDESVHGARILGAHVLFHIETFDLACNLAGKVRRIELGDEINAGLPGEKVGPGFVHRITYGSDAAQTGHDNATTAHAFKLSADLSKNLIRPFDGCWRSRWRSAPS
ncbi:hypothetical protein SDC9_117309 [bioreactor metagenome]|uniref:Uncharacterized protein n=1 Tax=bioreactor metagenome TaxID=1076179 RepID=A0A645C865_9ZZZZ